MVKKSPVGISDFHEMITEDYYYVDKTLFIKEIIDNGSKVILLPRPRRFGKTLNMSMLKTFFEKLAENNRDIFKDLNIYEYEECMQEQGKYPVIWISFKDVKFSNWKDCYNGLNKVIANEFRRHKYLINSGILDDFEANNYNKIMHLGSDDDTNDSLKQLSEYLYNYHNQGVIVLIDEYDTPVHSAHTNGYYDELMGFMRILLSSVLKDNPYMKKGILTGILRIAKESIFSGLNNPDVCTILDYKYSDKFGFLESEVKDMLRYYGIEDAIEYVRNWYNGYVFGENITIYNPWSIINYVNNGKKEPEPYWVNTSDNALIKNIVARGNEDLKIEFGYLIDGGEIEKPIRSDIVMGDLEKGNNNIWNFLLFTGYLKAVSKERRGNIDYYKLKIPNEEVSYLYSQIIVDWFEDNEIGTKLKNMLEFLTKGNMTLFNRLFKQIVLSTFSYFDITSNEPERVYHAFILGMLVNLRDRYEIKSNRESGTGRADILLIPKDTTKLGIVIEFKVVYSDEGETLEDGAAKALKQIQKKQYEIELVDRGIENVLKLGIAFCGKEVLIKSSS